MRLVALVDAPQHVCARYRLAAFRPYLEAAGHELTLASWPKRFFPRLAFDRRLRQADLVIVQRRLLSAWRLFLLRRAARRFWFDYDDAVFLRDSYHARGPYSARLRRGFARMVGAAERVLAGNSFLAREAASHTRPDKIDVVPTCVDVARYVPKRHVTSARVEMVWIGSSSTMQGLDLVRGDLERLGERLSFLDFRVVCDRAPTWNHLPILFSPWSEAREAEDLGGADIGVSWIPDDDWSRGKCGLKVLQYMAAALPVVANAVGVHPEMIEHERTGLLVRTPAEFAAAIERLACDAELRRRLGEAGRRRVEEKYHVAIGAAQWLNLLNKTSNARRCA
ncbi:MAG: glycosyltransferase family 4 protein [Gemmataceae bacterium]